jgi:hypothetical protein
MGMNRSQLLRDIDLPLALPSIVAGVRVAAVTGVGSATIAAAIGAGGLGEFIYRGLSMVDSTVILAGAIPASGLALAVDGAIWWAGRFLAPQRRARPRLLPAVAAALLVVGLAAAALATRSAARIVVGSKNTTEQIILGELLAQAIEGASGLTVDRRLNLGGTLICDRALTTGDIDVYVEYTGTALMRFSTSRWPLIRPRFWKPCASSTRDVECRCCPRSGSTTPSRFSCEERTPAGCSCVPWTMRRASRRDGGPDSATSFCSGPTAMTASRAPTGSGSWRRRAPWT